MYINRLKQEFDDRITMFRLEKIYILKDNCRMFTKTVIQKNGTCIYERKDSRLIGYNAVKQLEIEAGSQSKAHTRQQGKVDVKNDIFGLIQYCMEAHFKKTQEKKKKKHDLDCQQHNMLLLARTLKKRRRSNGQIGKPVNTVTQHF